MRRKEKKYTRDHKQRRGGISGKFHPEESSLEAKIQKMQDMREIFLSGIGPEGTSPCLVPPVDTQGYGRVTKNLYWEIKSPFFGFTDRGYVKTRCMHELFWLREKGISLTEKVPLIRICQTKGCLNPEHYIERDAKGLELLEYLPEDL